MPLYTYNVNKCECMRVYAIEYAGNIIGFINKILQLEKAKEKKKRHKLKIFYIQCNSVYMS